MKNFQQPTNFGKIYLVLSIFFCLNLSLTASDEILFRINKLANWKTYHWGVMNVSGKIIIHPKFAGLGEFQGETALAKSNQKWGVINRKGEFIKKPEFQDVREFENGLAWVIQNCSYWIAYECERVKF